MTSVSLTASQRRRSLAAVISSAGVAGLSMGLLMPLLTLILERQGVGATLIGLNAAVASLAVLASGTLMPRLVARIGVLPALYAGVALSVGVVLLLPVFPNVWAWFPLRFVYGLAAAVVWIVSETWINTIVSDRNRGQVIGLYSMVFGGGFAAGPMLITLVGAGGWVPFLVGAGLTAVAAVPLAAAHGLAPTMPVRSSASPVAAARRAPVVMGAALISGFVMVTVVSLLPLYGLRAGFGQQATVLMLTVFLLGNTLLQLPLGWLVDRWGRREMMLGCAALCVVAPALLPLGVATATVLWPLLFLWGAASAGLYTVGLTVLGDRCRPGELAAANAAFIMIFEAGSVTGPTLSGAAMDLWEPHGLAAVLALACAAFLAFAISRARRDGWAREA